MGDTDEAEIVRLAQNAQLLRIVGEKYPRIKDLLIEEPEGTLLSLMKQGAVMAMKGEVKLQIQHVGNHNRKAWADYLLKIEEWLDQCDNTEALAPARKHVAEYIHKVHYEKFPCWPSVGKTQESYVTVNTQIAYSQDDGDVLCAVEGDATVKDVREASDRYFAQIDGNPIFKVLQTVERKMRTMEDMVKVDPTKALQAMRQRKIDAITKSIESTFSVLRVQN